ncbi:MAG: hypothetical protein P4L84_11135 [Isosphaeraceae bacterium]|nr:hypothetical protein [Isosphaeraceae bacterium]
MSVLGYFQFGYFNLGLVTTSAGTPADFLSALVAYWKADAYLTAIVPEPYLGVAPAKTRPPYIEIHHIKGKAGGRNTGKGYWQDRLYQLSIWNPDADKAVAWGEAIITEFDKLIANPLTFVNGYQMGLYYAGDTLDRAEGYGSGGTIDFPLTISYTARVGRTRQ